MTLLEAIALGIVQGLTEFFPVSSSGHLVLAEALLGVDPPGLAFEVLVHFATVLSVLALYGRRIAELVSGAFRRQRSELRYLGMLALASVPAAVLGTALSGTISVVFDLPPVVAILLLVTGALVYATRWLVRRGEGSDPGWAGSLWVGVAQAVALLPGISRSGFTVVAALHARTRRAIAAEFSFLLSVPAILGAAALEVPQLLRTGSGIGAGALLAASLSAFVAGVLAIVLFVRWLLSGSFHRFAYYCWLVGGGYILYALVRA
ncbi:MAG: undecaprenyl-diphosphate phosphatase [Gemmatimonadota bacterium]|nr:MAG: undecaprenyl-diphosphate phosphatase [Gemmatimonadota bacterium]